MEKIKVLFICHGNICRSPLAEFILKDMVKKRGIAEQFMIASAATSREEIGNPVYPGAKRILNRLNIDCSMKRAVQLTRTDGNFYDLLIGMDHRNIENIKRIVDVADYEKIYRLMEFTPTVKDIADPWYTDNFEFTYQEIQMGCEGLIEFLLKEGKLK